MEKKYTKNPTEINVGDDNKPNSKRENTQSENKKNL